MARLQNENGNLSAKFDAGGQFSLDFDVADFKKYTGSNFDADIAVSSRCNSVNCFEVKCSDQIVQCNDINCNQVKCANVQCITHLCSQYRQCIYVYRYRYLYNCNCTDCSNCDSDSDG